MKARSTGRHAGTFTANDLRQLRLRSQLLVASEPVGAAETVRRLLAVQAQNLGGALWSVGQRAPGSTRGDVEAALAAGVVVLTWPMRGTLHLMHADDADWLLPLLTPRAALGRAKLWRDAGLTDAVFDRAAAVLFEALGDGPMARPEVLRLLNEAGISTEGQRGSHLLRHLAERQVIIFGPRRGKTQTFVRYADLIPAGGSELGRDECLRRLANRYVKGHGPATEQDLAWWSGLNLREARTAVALAAPDLAAMTVEGRRYYVDPEVLSSYEAEATTGAGADGDARADGRAVADSVGSGAASTLTPRPVEVTVFPRVHLLPGFDEFHIGYADRRLILASEHQAFVGPGKNGLFRSPVVVDGVVAGIWSASERKGNIDVAVSLFPDRVGPILPGVKMLSGTEMRRGVETATTLYGRFLGVEAHAAVFRS